MGKSKTNTQTQGVDAITAGRQQQVMDAGTALSKTPLAGMDPSIGAAQQNYGNAMQAGNSGLAALGGDAAAMQKLQNPYTQQVIGAQNTLNQQSNLQAQNNVNSSAANAGAFGGSRQAIQGAVTQAQNQQNQALQQQQMLQQGYSNAQDVAGHLANLGMGATGASAGLGQYQTQQAQAAQSHQFDTLAQAVGAAGSHGTVATQTQPGNLWGDVLGAAGTAASFLG